MINPENTFENHSFIFKSFQLDDVENQLTANYIDVEIPFDYKAYHHIFPQNIGLNEAIFIGSYGSITFPTVSVLQTLDELIFTCNCNGKDGKLCEHQALIFSAIIKKDDLRIFFDQKFRHQKLKNFALDYGLEHEPDLDAFFQVEFIDKKLFISPKLSALVPITATSLQALQQLISPETEVAFPKSTDTDKTIFVVFRQHKYYKYLFVELYEAETTKEGKIKNPLNPIVPLELIWQTEDHHELKFYTSIQKFQNHQSSKRSAADLTALKAIVKNPLGYDFYYHDSQVSEKITVSSLVSVKVDLLPKNIQVTVNAKNQFYELSGNLEIAGINYALNKLSPILTYFVLLGENLYLVDNLQVLGVMDILKKKPENMLIHQSKYAAFKTQLLAKLEDSIHVKYQYLKPATTVQLEKQGFNNETEKLIYLEDFGAHVMIIPVLRYGEAEIPIRTKRQIFATDEKGKEFAVKRNEAAEIDFTALLIRQHPDFKEQLENELYYFYLHKKRFLDENWFLNAFEEWQQHNISILGFNEIEGNKLNPNKVKISIKVISGQNWFNTIINARYGKNKVAIKQLHKAVKNKSKFVQLDDGTLGILPEEWIEKFSNYFNSGEIADEEILHTSKINFSAIEQFYDEDMLEGEVKIEIDKYRKTLADFNTIKEVSVPAELNATLRPYQKQGLNWLNFLDDFNFGGCLADDMGLGKTLQIIAFILSQKAKVGRNTNLLIVPTSLIFNWKAEVAKFAPSLKMLTIYGADRIKSTQAFDDYEIVLTSYGTVLSDFVFLKEYNFNYVFLDESQNIKNPESQRYKSVRMLKSRNKIVITGTPIENNTFDLYGQFSFACPGLLGSKKYFKDIYSTPIDKFKSNKRAQELQDKIKPFLLRRTKEQVAKDLPDKTEIVLYCEMQPEQRKVYDAYEKEFREYISATTNEELAKSPMNVLKGLTKLRQICDSPVLLGDDRPLGNASAKIEVLMEQIESKSPEHKILIFSQFVSMLDLIKQALIQRKISFEYLTGKTKNREEVVNSFQNQPQTRVFLISLKAGGTGLNLTEADYIYLVDPWWNPAVENQAIDRSHRIGQNKKVVAVRLICPDTVEEKMMRIQESKKDLANDLIKTDTSFFKSLSKNDLLGLL